MLRCWYGLEKRGKLKKESISEGGKGGYLFNVDEL
jgi:hypothetical protein